MILAALAVAATPVAETRVEAAVAVVRAYYAAVDGHDYRAAYRLWNGRRTYAAFRAGYADTAHVRVTFVPPFTAEGGAGSIYSDVKVRVAAVTRAGLQQRFAGTYTLRRVNDVDGSTAAQRRWHIVDARLKPVR